MARLPACLALVGLAFAAPACGGGGTSDPASEDVAPLVNPTVHVVDGEDFDLEPDRIVTSAVRAPNLVTRAPGDVLVSSTGFLRRVRAVTPSGDSVVIDTEQGSLEDVFQQAHVHGTVDPTAQEQAGGLAPKGWNLPTAKLTIADHRIPVGDGFIDLADGEFDFTPKIDFDLSMSGGHVDRFQVTAGGQAHTKLQVRYDLKKSVSLATGFVRFTDGIPVAEAPPAYSVFWVGTVPVVVAVKVRLLFKWDLSVAGEFQGDQTVQADGDATLGLSYEGGAWHDIASRNLSLSRDGTLALPSHTVTGDVTLTARLDVQFYETAGPYVGLEAYGGVRNQGDLANPGTWFIERGIRGIAGARVQVFGKALVGYETTLFDLHDQTAVR